MPYDRPLMAVVRDEEEATPVDATEAGNELLQPCGRFAWERIVRRLTLPWDVKAFALLLATWADGDGTRVRPGVPRLVAVTGRSEKTVRRWLRELRERYALLEQVTRGGGRGGTGRASDYRLVIPADLLDRAQLLDPDEEHHRVVETDSPPNTTETSVTAMTDQTEETPVIQMTSPTHPHPVDNYCPQGVDNSDSPVTQMTAQSGHADPIERSFEARFPRLSGHPGDHLPATYQTNQVGHLPTQPPEGARTDPSTPAPEPPSTLRPSSPSLPPEREHVPLAQHPSPTATPTHPTRGERAS